MRRLIPVLLSCFTTVFSFAQEGYWQQEANYEMNIDFDVANHQFEGTQTIAYTNHSPDTLDRVYYHLYFNAFQPGSMMDVRSRTIQDPDPRIRDRISMLKEDEIGYHKIDWIKQNGKKLDFEIVGTVCEVSLKHAILPGETVRFEMSFNSQVPVQIRRSGRFNQEGVDYTMTQWYPKLAEYDRDGWHTEPYVAREFHGVFGSFDVKINIDATYTVAGTGILQNPEEIGHGYADVAIEKDELAWHFKAENVHDFAWAADPAYRHLDTTLANGTKIHFFHIEDSTLNSNWERLVPYTAQLFEIMNAEFGAYPYKQFSVIQGGDGGMEYPMCTMITGGGSFGGLVSVTVHEAIHNWYYGVLASNESKYPWMDEGFTTYAQNIVLDSLFDRGRSNPHERSYRSYIANAKSRDEEPLSTNADLYETNKDYGVNSYSKGCVFLSQLEYIVGENDFRKGMLRYFNQWKFKHPTPTDFKRIMERTSGIELDWYFDAWIGTTKHIEYDLHNVISAGQNTLVELQRNGTLPFPAEVKVTLKNGEDHYFYVPLQIMRGAKPAPEGEGNWHQMADWPWAYPIYSLTIPFPTADIEAIALDPEGKVADLKPENQRYPQNTIRYQSNP
jgi:hypothetical protein